MKNILIQTLSAFN